MESSMEETVESNTYSTQRRKKIAQKIGKLKSKKCLVEIFEIMKSDPNRKYMENDNGMFFLANKLTDETFAKLEKYLRALNEKVKKKKVQKGLIITMNPENKDDENSFTTPDDSLLTSTDEKSKLSIKDRKILQKYNYYHKPDTDISKTHKSSDGDIYLDLKKESKEENKKRRNRNIKR
jgi:hypothetical protein